MIASQKQFSDPPAVSAPVSRRRPYFGSSMEPPPADDPRLEPYPLFDPDSVDGWLHRLFLRTAWKARLFDCGKSIEGADAWRLAVADWLERLGNPIRAAFVRECIRHAVSVVESIPRTKRRLYAIVWRERADDALFPEAAESLLEGVEYE